MNDVKNKNILIAISGGIAAYKMIECARLLKKQGAIVRVCLSPYATKFVTPLTFNAITDLPTAVDATSDDTEQDMLHIELAKWADIILLAPATANTIAKIAHGMADNLLTSTILASEAQLFIAPAMNQVMYHKAQTQINLQTLKDLGVPIIGPASGEQACGDVGYGRMEEPQNIIDALLSHSDASNEALAGTTVMVTGGATEEAIDPVRFISNRSSGKMAIALVEALLHYGATVEFILGTSTQNIDHLHAHPRCTVTTAKTANTMLEACQGLAKQSQWLIACAAVADYRVEQAADKKIKKTADTLTLALVKNPDILATLTQQHEHLFTVGFAAETNDVLEHARQKRKNKGIDMIIANQVSDSKAFGQNENEVWCIGKKSEHHLPLQPKSQLALAIIEHLMESQPS